MVARRFTDSQEQEICRRYSEGESAVELGVACAVGNGTVGRILRKWGVEVRTFSEVKGGLPRDAELAVCAFYENGATMKETAAMFKISAASVDRILIRNNKKKRTSREANQTQVSEGQEREICARYAGWEGIDTLAHEYKVGRKRLIAILKKHEAIFRDTLDRKRIFTEDQEKEICNRYVNGENTKQLAPVYDTTYVTIRQVLIRNGIERRAKGMTGDTVQDALDYTGRHSEERDCCFYLFALARFSETHCKPGISVDIDDRIRVARGEYGEEYLRVTFAVRRDAFFIEQAFLHATRAMAKCPKDLWDWAGASEVRSIPATDALLIAGQLIDEMDELGAWDFAALRVPMTTAQRAICQQRALADAFTVAA